MGERTDGIEVARRLLASGPPALLGLVAGSVARGVATDRSDLDLVIVAPRVPRATRSTFVTEGWTVELFVHDPGTLDHYLRRLDPTSGIPAHSTMIVESVAVWEQDPDLLPRIRATAERVLRDGPAPLPRHALEQARYQLTITREHLRRPRDPDELRAYVAQLHRPLAELWLRGRRRWFAEDRRLRSRLTEDDAEMAATMDAALRSAMVELDPTPTIAVIDRVLEALGGPLGAGYSATGPPSWRIEGG
ncbi:MAG: nucleotidyltransferase domain-containing protein [Alphaproteobacteria bacterium]|nr:nucleotidyltransferase domain-containing protein [Alphaproteobacteria bacterium]MCB9696229.1 nucleotidyltransferase domain-containing protein [Alphaproteobacteria bacterium]